MRILVLGEQGMLGHVVKSHFKNKGYDVKGTDLKSGDYVFDVRDSEKIEEIIEDFSPTHIINCIGILNDEASSNQSLAVLVNSYFPHYMDEITKKKNIKFIHISTDCVFSGKDGNYREDSFKDAISFYGMSKSLGEINNDYNLTLRTSIIGPDDNEKGIGLFKWFMSQEETIHGFTNVYWSGVTTIELAKCIEKAIIDNLSGLYHVTNNEKISKYDLLNLIKKQFNKNIIINKDDSIVSDKSFISTKNYNFNVPSYDTMIKEMYEYIKGE